MEICLARKYHKITEFKGLYYEKNINCVKAETETYKVQKRVPNTSADLCKQRGREEKG